MSKSSTTTETAKQIAGSLLEIGAVFLRPNEPFTWTSGIKSPIYCDNRVTLSHPEIRSMIADGFINIIRELYPDTELIAGVATAGIAHAAIIAERMNLPMVYVRASTKSHGRENQIEGEVKPGQRAVLIEDLVSTAGSSITAAEALTASGVKLQAMLAIFSYGLPAAKSNLDAAQLTIHSLSNYDTLIDVALSQGKIQNSELETLRAWKQSPSTWKV